ncbi:MAG TPA: NYN domain-containing protein [Candidatus Saccharimonadales bacterium]
MTNNYAFIDGQNLNAGVKALGWKLDHRKFREYLETQFEVTRAYMFIGFMEEHQDLYNALQESGFICVFKPLIRHADMEIKGNVDADLVLQAMIDVERYDQAVIVSGDGDFAGLIRHLADKNKLRQVVIPNKDRYSSLFDRLDKFDTKHVTYMNELRSQLAYKDRGRRNFSPKDNKK